MYKIITHIYIHTNTHIAWAIHHTLQPIWFACTCNYVCKCSTKYCVHTWTKWEYFHNTDWWDMVCVKYLGYMQYDGMIWVALLTLYWKPNLCPRASAVRQVPIRVCLCCLLTVVWRSTPWIVWIRDRSGCLWGNIHTHIWMITVEAKTDERNQER